MRRFLSVTSHAITAFVAIGLVSVALGAPATLVQILNGTTVVSNSNPLPVSATITPSGTQDVNLVQVGGATVATGSGTSTGALRVELPTNGTGVVGLNAGSAIVGKVGIDQTTPGTTNLVTTPAIGTNGSAVKTSSILAGVSDGTNQQQVVAPIALGDGVNGNNTVSVGGFVWNGATWDRMPGGTTGVAVKQATASNLKAQVVGAGTAGTADAGVLTVQGIASMTPLTVDGSAVTQPVSYATTGSGTATGALRVELPTNGTGVVGLNAGSNLAGRVNLDPQAANGLTNYVLEPAASDNHANIKNGAGTVYGIQVFNNSATLNYIRLYNAASGFNGCNSATNLAWEGNIPASTSGAGFVAPIGPYGIAFSTGISICVTSGYGQTNTTNATASAMSVNIQYK